MKYFSLVTNNTYFDSFTDSPGPCAGKITVSRVTEEKCTLAWNIPEEDGGAEITHYIIERRETSRLHWVIVEAECQTLSTVVTKLIKNNEYLFRVRAVNKYGPGVPLESEPVIARNAFSECYYLPFCIRICGIILMDKQCVELFFFFFFSHLLKNSYSNTARCS